MVTMAAKKVTYFLTFIAAIFSVYSEHVSPMGDRVSADNKNFFSFDFKPDLSLNPFSKPINVCKTADCKKIAAEYIGTMNKSVNPCEDFYEFTCGRWNEVNPRIPSAVVNNRFDIATHTFYRRLSDIFEKEQDASDILPVKQGKKWYHACMDTEKLNARGMEPITSIMQQVGGWPVSMEKDEWSVDDYPWQTIENHYARLMGRNVFYDIKIEKREEQSEFGSIVLTPPELLEKSRRHFFYDEYPYKLFVRQIVKLFAKANGAVVPDTVLDEDIREFIKFEKEVLELITKKPFDSTKLGPAGAMAFGKFVELNKNRTKNENPSSKTSIDWETGIKQIFQLLHIDVKTSDPIYVSNQAYFYRIGNLLERTPARTIVNYVHWNFIITMLKHTTEVMREEIFFFETSHGYSGYVERSPRWMECAQETMITYAATYAFAKTYYSPSTESTVKEMIENIQREMEISVSNSDWLDESSKLQIMGKIKSICTNIGYPKWYTNGTAVTNYYKGLAIGTQYFENVLSYMIFDMKRRLMAPVISGENEYAWPNPRSGYQYAAYSNINAVALTPILLQLPFFQTGLPDYINYGLLGSVLGHEVAHSVGYGTAFRDRKQLNLSEKTIEGAYDRMRCFVNQYDRYFGEPEKKGASSKNYDLGNSMGASSKDENIADTTGLEAAFRAYKKLKVEKGRSDLKLPGLEEFTDEQLFLISFGSVYCNRKKPGFGKMARGNVYSPPNYRVNGAISNLPDFKGVFNCPAGSPMNPIDKCSLWKRRNSEIKLEFDVLSDE